MSDEIKVTVVKPFLNGASMVDAGDEITVVEDRARDLERNGLITREIKKAPDHANKKAPEPKNKGKA